METTVVVKSGYMLEHPVDAAVLATRQLERVVEQRGSDNPQLTGNQQERLRVHRPENPQRLGRQTAFGRMIQSGLRGDTQSVAEMTMPGAPNSDALRNSTNGPKVECSLSKTELFAGKPSLTAVRYSLAQVAFSKNPADMGAIRREGPGPRSLGTLRDFTFRIASHI